MSRRRVPRRPLPFLGRLDRYVAGHFVGSYLTALFLVMGLYVVLDMASNLPEFLAADEDGRSVGFTVALRYYLVHMPFLFLQVAPFVTLLAGMFTANRMLTRNEVTAVLAAGISVRRLLLPVFLLGGLLAVGMFLLRETLVESLADLRDRYAFELQEKSTRRHYEDIVVHDLSGSFVFLDSFEPGDDEDPVPRIGKMWSVLADSDPYMFIEAQGAVWDGAGWRLEDGRRKVVGGGGDGPGATRRETAVERLDGFEFDPELVLTYRRAMEDVHQLSFAEVQSLIRREPEDAAYQTIWHYHLTFPLANLVLLFVGLPLLFQYERGRGSERMALGGVLCLAYFSVDFVLRNLGLGGGLSPILAGWIPVLLFTSLGVVMVDSMRS